jgi:hypothetical protein
MTVYIVEWLPSYLHLWRPFSRRPGKALELLLPCVQHPMYKAGSDSLFAVKSLPRKQQYLVAFGQALCAAAHPITRQCDIE